MTAATSRPSIEATVAGFIVWLSRRRVPLVQRRRGADEVERFLRWQRDRRESGESRVSEDAYYADLRHRGIGEDQITEVRTVIGMFRHYLITDD
jgi:hypothetical protein